MKPALGWAITLITCVFLIAYLLVAAKSWLLSPQSNPLPIQSTPQPSGMSESNVLLESLEVKGRAPKTGYSRDQFGQMWSDDTNAEFGHNGCDTRNDILRRDLVETTLKPNTRGCVVLTGLLHDPYTATDIQFTRGRAVQIDHVVALGNAWVTGAQKLDDEKRREFVNDPLNLLAVSGPVNVQKSDSDAATWLPPNKAFRCEYVSKQLQVKAKYGLWLTPPEKDAIQRVLHDC
ncbi:HNH endonuclease family protein [Staphylococcus chromogenes]|nr:HNH endonuclease family protein [Staphylococcus chromogenes]